MIFYIKIFIMFSMYICDICRFYLLSFILSVILSLSKSSIRNCCFHHIYAHDNSYLSVEYINWVLWIDLTISINTSSRRKYRKRYIDNFSLLMKKNSHYMREVNKLILGTIYHILPQMLILMRYDYYRRTSW